MFESIDSHGKFVFGRIGRLLFVVGAFEIQFVDAGIIAKIKVKDNDKDEDKDININIIVIQQQHPISVQAAIETSIGGCPKSHGKIPEKQFRDLIESTKLCIVIGRGMGWISCIIGRVLSSIGRLSKRATAG